MDKPWHIELLGRLRATQGERVVTRFRARKTGVLLAYLAYHLERPHPREELIELLWPEADPRSGRSGLSRELSSLRRQLEPPGVPPGAVLLASRDSIQLNPAACATDVQAFEAAVQSAARARGGAERIAHLTEAVDLYRGELLPAYFEDWILPERQRLAEAYLHAIEQLIGHLEQAGDRAQALDYARRAVAVDPLREATYGPLFRLLVAVGQPEAARRAYHDLEQRLQRELGEPVSDTTRQLLQDLETAAAPHLERRQRSGQEPADPPEGSEPLAPAPSATSAGTELPTGTVTFLLTDIVRSTALWEQTGPAFSAALAGHHELLRREFERHGGREVKEAGDSFLVAFSGVAEAVACALAGQRALIARAWPAEVGPLQVRMALHTGDVALEKGEYRSLVLHHASRMLAAAHGEQIICSELTAALLRHSSPGTMDAEVCVSELGLYRLRDVTTPERLFQVHDSGLPAREFPPPNALPVHEGHLPLQFTRFFDREEEILQLCELLGTPLDGPNAEHTAIQNPNAQRAPEIQNRLLTLTGPGGSGKTRLAVEVGHRLRECFHGALWFVPLQDLTDACLIPDKLLDALRLPHSPQAEPLEQAVAFLSRQPSLLLLDNFEHLVAEGAPLVQSLLEQVPDLICLVTSRQRLNLPGEQAFSVAPLPTPAERGGSLVDASARAAMSARTTDHQPLSTLLQCPSIALFVDRAQAARPDFQVTRTNAGAVAELCSRLEGLPLALELAAARVGVMTPEQMLGRLEQRLALLVTRQRGAPARHSSLRAALDSSYQLLSPELQRFFTRLSVFRGGWTLGAAEAVCESANALEYLEQLRECSLVQASETSGEMRFRLLETVREYGAEQLGPEEQAAVGHQHASYYVALAERAERGLWGPEQTVWQERLATERDNLRAALQALEEQGQAEAGLRLAAALCLFWARGGYHTEGRDRLARLLALPEASEPRPSRRAARAKALYAAGVLASYQGDYAAARPPLEESVAIWRELGDRQPLADAISSLGQLANTQGDYAEARSRFEQSLALRRELGINQDIAISLRSLADLTANQGDDEAARPLYEESLAIARQLDDAHSIASVLLNLGYVVRRQADFETARSLHEESLKIFQGLNDQHCLPWALYGLAKLAFCQGDYSAARSLYTESLVMRREQGSKRGVPEAMEGLAEVAAAQRAWERTARLLAAAAALREALGTVLPPRDYGEYERHRAAARAELGETPFAAAWAKGLAMTSEEAVAEAVQAMPLG